MSFENGDRVRITTKNSMHTGKEGVIINAYGPEQTILVSMAEKGNHVGFFAHEVVKINRTEDEEIEKIATALLVAEHNMDWTWEDALERAGSLFRAGVRFCN